MRLPWPSAENLLAIYEDLAEGVCESPPGPPTVDISLTKSDSPFDPSPLCEIITYTLVVSNVSAHEALGVTLTDTVRV